MAVEEKIKKDLVVYPESIEAMETLKKQGIPTIVLTAGDETAQKRKIALTQIPYDELVIVPTAKGKVVEVSRLLKKYGKPLAVFDDRADILDLIRESFQDSSDVVTVWVHRVNSNFPRGKYEHIEIKDLSEESLAKVIY
ncbi:HAD family hydrolase [Patescibacteria group bacterium]|nr:HAD family hydrolase [Patescibacteria group bacterium]